MGVTYTNNNNDHNLYTNKMAIGDYKCIWAQKFPKGTLDVKSTRC